MNSNTKFKKIVNMVIITAILVAIDQITKFFAEHYLYDNSVDIISNFFKLDLLYNSGAAFGILKNSRILFCVLTVFFCIVLEFFYFKMPDENKFNILKYDIIILFSGAIGNLIDRIKTGEVIDFLSFKFGDYYFPTFNIADIYVTVSAILLLILVVFYYSDSDFEKIFHTSNNK